MSPSLALVQTVDFFTPMVDDPYDFGAIAAANAVSDVYAMGGVPKLALSILCFPAETGDPAVLREIVRGGADALKQAGVLIMGGHSVRDPEIKFGYAVTREVHPKRVVTNAGIHGLISNVKDTTVIVKVADNVKLEMEKTAVTNVVKSVES